MSWDVLLFKSAHSSAHEMPKDFRPDPLGDIDQIRQLLRHALPQIDLRDPTWGVLDGPDWSIEFNIGKESPLEALMLHVRGGDDALSAVRAAVTALDARAFDCTVGEFLDFDGGDAAAGLRSWRAFKDRAVKK